MADEGAMQRKHERLAAETARYGRLRELEAVTNETNRGLETSLAAVAERRAAAEPLLDRALACLAGC
jgi:hypothetical protein